MDYKTLLTTFGLIFLAEMGDKTQLAAVLMVTKTKAPLAVFVGATLALAAVTLIGVLAGELLTKWVPQRIIHRVAAVGFIVIGVLLFFGKD